MEVFIGHRNTTFSWRRWINYQPEKKNTFGKKYEMPKPLRELLQGKDKYLTFL